MLNLAARAIYFRANVRLIESSRNLALVNLYQKNKKKNREEYVPEASGMKGTPAHITIMNYDIILIFCFDFPSAKNLLDHQESNITVREKVPSPIEPKSLRSVQTCI